MADKRICVEDGCGKPMWAKLRCQNHYNRHLRGLPPWSTKTPPGAPIEFARAALTSDTDTCILWPFAKRSKEGYGSIYDPDDDRDDRAHRWVCRKAHGEPVPGHQARHSCHEPRCINPKHLQWGTNLENVWDSVRAGRRSIGENRPGARLTDALVSEMRLSDATHKYWAERLGINPQLIGMARCGKTWKHVPTPPRPKRRNKRATQPVDEYRRSRH